MANSEEQKPDQKKTQKEKIDQLKARLQKEEAKLRSQTRKERNGQLMAFGIYLEAFLRDTEKQRKAITRSMPKYLTGRTLERGLAGLKRISEEVPSKKDETASKKKEISSEPPSQPPAAEATEKSQGSA